MNPIDLRIEKLKSGATVKYREKGNSMTPIIKSRQPVIAAPIKDLCDLAKDMIVFCKVKGHYYTHKVYAVDKEKKRVLIGNNHGHINGWTKQVYGKIIAIE